MRNVGSEPGVVAHACNPSIQEDEVSIRTILGYGAKPCPKEENKQPNQPKPRQKACILPYALVPATLSSMLLLGWQANLWRNVSVILGDVWFKRKGSPPPIIIIMYMICGDG